VMQTVGNGDITLKLSDPVGSAFRLLSTTCALSAFHGEI
jgi:hypothetical protein